MTYQNISGRWLFYAALLLFIFFKIPYLDQAFYWDESWVYAPAVKLMYEHGPSLLPDAIPVDYSRGHPLLYHAGCAAWMKVFGDTNFSMHSFALAVSMALAVSTYEVMRSIFGARVGLTAVLLLLVNITFFCESSMVLTDVPLALFAFLSLYFYVRERYLTAMLMLTLLYYTKESGWVMAGVLGIDMLVAIYNRAGTRAIFMKCLTIIVPLAVTALFFIAQKKVLGWYINPGHVGIMNWNFQNTLYNTRKVFSIIFWKEEIYLTYVVLGLVFLGLAIHTRQYKYLKYIIGGIVLYLNVAVFTDKDAVYYVFILMLIAAIVWFFVCKFPTYTRVQVRFLKYLVAFCTLYIYFCCINFFEDRYLFPALFIISIVLFSVVFERATALPGVKVWGGALVLVLFVSFASYFGDSNELLQTYRVNVQQQLVTYLEKNNMYDKNIYSPSFLNKVHLEDPNTGFLASHRTFSRICEVLDDSVDVAIFDNIEPVPQWKLMEKDKRFYLMQTFRYKGARAEIYGRRVPPPGFGEP